LREAIRQQVADQPLENGCALLQPSRQQKLNSRQQGEILPQKQLLAMVGYAKAYGLP
jgi:hypothetical protein